MLDVLFEAYADPESKFKINWLLLRYIDSVDFGYEKDDIFSFLGKNLKTKINIYKKLFEKTRVSKLPFGTL